MIMGAGKSVMCRAGWQAGCLGRISISLESEFLLLETLVFSVFALKTLNWLDASHS